jgi:hypothetical protein
MKPLVRRRVCGMPEASSFSSMAWWAWARRGSGRAPRGSFDRRTPPSWRPTASSRLVACGGEREKERLDVIEGGRGVSARA